MKLRKAQVQKYKCVEDSDEWRVDQVTCLVGKNEAGKSAILEALYKLNPVDKSFGVFTSTDYPRRAALTDAGKRDMEHAKVIITEWTLDEPNDVEALSEAVPELAVSDDAVITISKGYDGSRTWDTPIDEGPAVEA